MRRGLSIALLSLCAATTAARADDDDAAAKKEAVRLMTEGDAEFQGGDAKAALAKYHEAYDAFPSPKLYFVMARAEEALGKLAQALTHYEQFLAEVADVKKPLKKQVGKSIAGLLKKVGVVTFQLDAEGAVITVDGTPVGESPMEKPIYVDPGPHTFGATLDGMMPAKIEQTVGPGEQATILLELKEAPRKVKKPTPEPEGETEPEPETPEAVSPGRPSRTGFWIGLTLTGVLLTTGTITGIMAMGAHDDFLDESKSLDDRKAAKDSGETLAIVTDVCIVGGLAAGAYTTWYYLKKMRGSREAPATSGARVTPIAGPTFAGASASFAF